MPSSTATDQDRYGNDDDFLYNAGVDGADDDAWDRPLVVDDAAG